MMLETSIKFRTTCLPSVQRANNKQRFSTTVSENEVIIGQGQRLTRWKCVGIEFRSKSQRVTTSNVLLVAWLLRSSSGNTWVKLICTSLCKSATDMCLSQCNQPKSLHLFLSDNVDAGRWFSLSTLYYLNNTGPKIGLYIYNIGLGVRV